MPLEHILQAMRARAAGEIDRIVRGAEKEAAQLVSEAQAAADEIRARHRARVESMLLSEAAAIENQAKVSALQTRAAARERLLDGVFARAEAALARLRESPEYPSLFRALVEEALGGGGDVRIAYVDARDAALARDVLAEQGRGVDVEAEQIPLGGLRTSTADRRVITDNTLAGRLERARAALRGPVAELLGGRA